MVGTNPRDFPSLKACARHSLKEGRSVNTGIGAFALDMDGVAEGNSSPELAASAARRAAREEGVLAVAGVIIVDMTRLFRLRTFTGTAVERKVVVSMAMYVRV